MAQTQDPAGTLQTTRRGPAPPNAAVQEAKRLEKMQTVSSSHRSSGPMQRAAPPAKDGPT